MQNGRSDAAPQITVVIPVWDEYAGAPIAAALESLREQDTPKRVLIVDNASVKRIAPGPDAEVIRCPERLALGAARNLGLSRVQTPYVVVWDADDVMLPGTLDFLLAAISSDAGLVAFGAAILESPSGNRHRWPRTWIGRLARFPRLFAWLHCVWSLYPTTGATIMRTAQARAGGGYGEAESGEDWVLGVSLAFRGRLGWSERPGRSYRLHPRSVWARHGGVGDLSRHARAVRERVRADRGIPGWARRSLLLIAVGQHAAIGAHGFLDRVRTVRNPGPRGEAGGH